jgi:hypothetical protein
MATEVTDNYVTEQEQSKRQAHLNVHNCLTALIDQITSLKEKETLVGRPNHKEKTSCNFSCSTNVLTTKAQMEKISLTTMGNSYDYF